MPEAIADLVASTPAPTATMDVGSLTGADKATDITGQMADLQRAHVGKQTQIMADSEQRTQKAADQQQQAFDRMYNAPGMGPDALTKWNEEEQSAKYATDPIQSFASLGSTFAILASAFTHAPMENALNGAASAMNAIKAGNDEGYKRAYQAWKDNTDLAVKRHNMMHTAYQDATQLLATNMELGREKLKNEAIKFGDQKVLTLLEAGLNKEVFDLIESRQKLMLGTIEAQTKMADELGTVARAVELGFDQKNPGSPQSRAAIAQVKQEKSVEAAQLDQIRKPLGPEVEAYETFRKENPEATAEDKAKFIHSLKQRNQSPEQIAVLKFMEDNPEATAEEYKKFVTSLRAEGRNTGGPGKTMAGIKAERVRELKKPVEEGGQGMPHEKAIEQANREFAAGIPPSPNRVDQLKSRVDQFGHSVERIDSALEVLDKHILSAGIGGRAARMAERIGNIFGSSETDRVQFMRTISYLQEAAPRLLHDSNGRPLSAEAKKVTDIIAGLSAGDTTANTKRALEELKKLYGSMRAETLSRIEGTWKPGGPDAPPPAAAPPKAKPSWMDGKPIDAP